MFQDGRKRTRFISQRAPENKRRKIADAGAGVVIYEEQKGKGINPG
jgi:hypothetical protein